jgi:hypothetical protein
VVVAPSVKLDFTDLLKPEANAALPGWGELIAGVLEFARQQHGSSRASAGSRTGTRRSGASRLSNSWPGWQKAVSAYGSSVGISGNSLFRSRIHNFIGTRPTNASGAPMAIDIRSLTLITLASTLVACSGKPTDTAASAGAGSKPATAAAAPASGGSAYAGVPIYPGMTTLTTNDIGGGAGGTMHSGNFRSTDPQDKIVAFYREALTKEFGAAGSMPSSGEGWVRLVGTNNVDKQVTVLIRAGDSGEQIVGIQVTSKN